MHFRPQHTRLMIYVLPPLLCIAMSSIDGSLESTCPRRSLNPRYWSGLRVCVSCSRVTNGTDAVNFLVLIYSTCKSVRLLRNASVQSHLQILLLKRQLRDPKGVNGRSHLEDKSADLDWRIILK
jgi:hypothetical protein